MREASSTEHVGQNRRSAVEGPRYFPDTSVVTRQMQRMRVQADEPNAGNSKVNQGKTQPGSTKKGTLNMNLPVFEIICIYHNFQRYKILTLLLQGSFLKFYHLKRGNKAKALQRQQKRNRGRKQQKRRGRGTLLLLVTTVGMGRKTHVPRTQVPGLPVPHRRRLILALKLDDHTSDSC